MTILHISSIQIDTQFFSQFENATQLSSNFLIRNKQQAWNLHYLKLRKKLKRKIKAADIEISFEEMNLPIAKRDALKNFSNFSALSI